MVLNTDHIVETTNHVEVIEYCYKYSSSFGNRQYRYEKKNEVLLYKFI